MSHLETNARDEAAENLAAQIVHRAAEIIASDAADVINAGLERFGVAYRVAADDSRLADESVNLAAAHDAAHRHEAGMHSAHLELATLDRHIAAIVVRTRALRAGIPSPAQGRELGLLGEDLSALRDVACQARLMLADVDNGSRAEAVARCQAALERAQHGIVAAAMADYVDAAERALVDAVGAMRELNRIGVKHFGEDVTEGWIPSPAVEALFAG